MIWIVLLSDTDLRTRALTPGLSIMRIRSLERLDRRRSPRILSVALPHISIFPGLHLNAFRGVRAISKFDWPFTPTLTSSRSFSTLIGADLHPVLPGLHPGQG